MSIWPLKVEASLLSFPHGNAAMLTFGEGAEGLEFPVPLLSVLQ